MKRAKTDNACITGFIGYYCKDCIFFAEGEGGGGACPFKEGIVWPGDRICDNFSQ